MTWEQARGELLESDVVAWQEAIWSPNRSRRKRRPWGRQAVIGQIIKIDGDFGQIIKIDGDFVVVKVLKVEIVENTAGSDLPIYKIGATITKKRQTLLKGNPERLHWSEEDVRAALLAESHVS